MVRSNFVIRYNNSPNIEVIKELLSNWVLDDEFTYRYFLRGCQSKNSVCTYEAYDNDLLVGLVTAWKSEFHPYCTYFAIVTKPHIGFEIESVLTKALYNFKEVEFPLQTSIWESSYRLKGFYEENGFLEVRRTYSPLLRTSKINCKKLFPEFIGQDLNLKNIKNIANHQELKFELINLVRENYEKSHRVNPIAVHGVDKWEELIFNENTIQSGSYVLLKNDEIHAYSLLHYSENPNQFEFGWRGTKENTDVRFMLLLTAYQINFAIENGVNYIEAEVDTTDYYSLEMLKFFPFSPTPTLLSFQKKSFYEQSSENL